MSRSRAAARSARPRKGSPSSDDDLQESAPAQDGICFLCGKVLGKDTMWFKGKTFHKPACWLAVRCYRRTFPDKNQLELADRRMASDAAGWRSSVLPLVRVPGGTRDSSAREALKKKHRTIKDTFTASETIQDDIVLSRKRFAAYMRFWEAMDESDAEEEFDKLLSSQRGRYSEDGEDRVLVQDNMKVRNRSGTSAHKQTIFEDAHAEAQPVATTRRSRSRTRRRDHDESPRRGSRHEPPGDSARKGKAPSSRAAPSISRSRSPENRGSQRGHGYERNASSSTKKRRRDFSMDGDFGGFDTDEGEGGADERRRAASSPSARSTKQSASSEQAKRRGALGRFVSAGGGPTTHTHTHTYNGNSGPGHLKDPSS